METIFTLGNYEETSSKINLDDLYEETQKKNLNTLSIYNRILSRIHTKIKSISKKHNHEQVCWYIIPEMILGVNKYNNEECIVYIINKLKENGFKVLYTHPNMLFISWSHWVPTYVRQELKKKTGIIIDGYGNKIGENNELNNNNNNAPIDPNTLMLNMDHNSSGSSSSSSDKLKLVKDYKSIDSYKPSGNLIYNQELLKKIEHKIDK
jgi:hypothetical protein